MALTDVHIRNAKATRKVYTLGAYDGLSLLISAQGSKALHFRYQLLGKRSRMSFGTYPELSLHDARTMRVEARAMIAKGINPRLVSDACVYLC
ncbi:MULTISPECIES: Arm DNA-binding domain-containing protein [Achromobacter]|uniref:Arm DNA-binding domain-containing protein n=1 Tax=Achromobacter TaxID=222 RepID=UPI00244AE19F|nr:Arm DNA-binding domain-containing protein [Achromobacter mucicolens]MDH1521004.1 Arm DNA-binding domain-containing protein [Achromobacter mucicolens]